MQQYNKFKYAASVIAVSTILAGCLNSESQNDFVSGQAAQAQASLYAQGLQSYATLAQGQITSSSAWRNGNPSVTETIDLSTSVDYQYNGALSESLRSGYCRVNTTNPQDIMHVTWFDQADSDGKFAMGGVGHSGAQNIVRQLSDFVSADNLGIFNNNLIKTIGSTSNTGTALPSNCSFDIPNGSPVLVFEMLAPKQNTELQDFTENKTISCDAGEVGHQVMSLTAKKSPEGIMHIGGSEYSANTNLNAAMFDSFWTLTSSHCRPEITLDNVDSFSTTSDAIDMSALITTNQTGSDIVNAVNTSIGQIDCKETHQVDPETGEKIRKKDIVDEFSTCTTPHKPKSLGEIDERELKLYDTEDITIACKGDEGSFTETHLGYSANVTFPEWDGEESYTRDIMLHGVQDDLEDDREIDEKVLFKDSWVGVNIECERPERLNISCATARPGLAGNGNLNNLDNRGFNYDRAATISGWKDPETYERNDIERTNWIHVPGASGCAWRQERTDILGCPPGQNGQRTETYRREFSENTPGSGSWSTWTMISSSDTCTNPSPPTPSSGSEPDAPDPDPDPPGGDGGGTSCLLAGTRVLMSDGSEKAIEDIIIGDVTAGGRVLQTYKRNFNNGAIHTSEGIFMNNGGLLDYDGIEATGRHPLHINGKWCEMGDNTNATPLVGTLETIVYNILTEDHLIPIIGNSGKIYAFSDDLNNIYDSAEKGRIKNLTLFTSKDSKTA